MSYYPVGKEYSSSKLVVATQGKTYRLYQVVEKLCL